MNVRTYEVNPFAIDEVRIIPVGAYSSGGISDEAKQAILDAFEHVAWTDDQGQTYVDAIRDAFFPPATLLRIKAVYTQSGTVYTTDSLDSLKSDLVVTAVYTDSSTEAVTTYTLSGTLTAGQSTITVSYGGKTTTFKVNVTAPATLDSISAVYTQSGTVYDTDSLDSLKTDLVVTATYSDSTTETVAAADYTLSGTLTVGTSTVTVTYSEKTTTFSVTVTAGSILPAGYTQYDYIRYTGSAYSTSGTASPYIIATQKFPNLDNLIIDFDCRPHTAQTGGTAGLIGGHASATGNANGVQFYGRTDTQRVSCFSHGSALGIDNIPNMQVGKVIHVNLDPGTASPSTLTVDSLSTTAAWTSSNTINEPIGLFGTVFPNSATLKSFVDIGVLRVYNVSDESLAGEFYPCVRDSDNVMGIYDTVTETFYTATNTNVVTIGNANCMYTVGNWEA